MTPSEFSRELHLWRWTGEQDAANVMDPNEIEDRLGPKPSRQAIKKWLLDQGDQQQDFPEDATESQRRQLIDAWADGWSSYAHRYMLHAHEEWAGRSPEEYKEGNPIPTISYGTAAALIAAGAVIGGVAYWLYTKSQAAAADAQAPISTGLDSSGNPTSMTPPNASGVAVFTNQTPSALGPGATYNPFA